MTNAFSAMASSSQLPPDDGGDESTSSRKRFRSDRGKAAAPMDIPMDPGPPTGMVIDRPAGLDHALTRELVNR